MHELFTVQEAADVLRLSTRTVYSRIRSGELRAVRVSARKFLVDSDDLKQYVEACRDMPRTHKRPLLDLPNRPGAAATWGQPRV